MTKKRRICFIDDEEDELARARRVLSQNFNLGTGSDLDSAVSNLGQRPQLFLLDMYYGPTTSSSDRIRVAQGWRGLRKAQTEFYDLLRSLGQSSKGGLQLAAHVRARYPGVPIVFFTRKGSLEDADEAFRDGAIAVLKKPDAADPDEEPSSLAKALDASLAAHKDELVRTLSRIIDQHSWWARHTRFRGFLEGVAASLVAGLLLAGTSLFY